MANTKGRVQHRIAQSASLMGARDEVRESDSARGRKGRERGGGGTGILIEDFCPD